MRRYSVFALAREGLRHHAGWDRAWASPAPRSRYDVVVVGAGGHGLATAYYLGKNFGITDIAVLEIVTVDEDGHLLAVPRKHDEETDGPLPRIEIVPQAPRGGPAPAVGDRVLFGKYSGQTVKVDGEELLVMREEDLFAVVQK